MRMRIAALLLAVLTASATGCGGGDATPVRASASAPACPARFAGEWQRLANRVGAPVYCPAWLPDPFTPDLHSQWTATDEVSSNGTYLIDFNWYEVQSGTVHVVLHGYPRRTAIPRCVGDDRRPAPCFDQPTLHKRLGGRAVTVYTRNRAIDTWHVVYAWRHDGSLYAVSEHVAKPLTYRQVLQNLDRIVKNLVLVEPKAA